MGSLVSLFNRLLPFATPGTPLLQDLVHLGVISALLYFAPQIQERFRKNREHADAPVLEDEIVQEMPAEAEHNIDADEENQDRDDDDFEARPNEDAPPDLDVPGLPAEGEAGPANGPNMPAQRNVGAKKAKSLARRDQRRAYNEFMRTQGEAQRARDAEGADAREAEQAAERERRREAAAAVEAKKAKEREQRKEQERKERENEISRRDRVLALVRRELDEAGTVNLFDVASQIGGYADEIWVERIMNAGGMLGWSPDGERLTLILSTGWVARIGREHMKRLYESVASAGSADVKRRVDFAVLGSKLEGILKEGS